MSLQDVMSSPVNWNQLYSKFIGPWYLVSHKYFQGKVNFEYLHMLQAVQ